MSQLLGPACSCLAGAGPGLDSRQGLAPLASEAWSGINHNMPRERDAVKHGSCFIIAIRVIHKYIGVTSDPLLLMSPPSTGNR